MIDLLDLKATLGESPGRLELTWRIANRTRAPVYVTDRGVVIEPGGRLAVAFVPRVRVEEPATVVLGCALQALDAAQLRAAPVHAFTQRITAGDEVSRRASMDLPLREHGLRSAEVARALTCTTLRLALSVIPDDPRLDATEQEIADTALWRLSAVAWELHHVVVATVDRVAIPVTTRLR